MTTTAFDVYRELQAIRLHFNPSANYDYFKYNGKTNSDEESMRRTKDRWIYEILSRKHPNDYSSLILANAIEDNLYGPKQLMQPTAQKIHLEYLRVIDSFSYEFQKDLNTIYETIEESDSDLKTILVCQEPGKHTPIIRLYLAGYISLHTLTIILHEADVIDSYDTNYEDDPTWDTCSFLIRKYYPFLNRSQSIKEITDSTLSEFIQKVETRNKGKVSQNGT